MPRVLGLEEVAIRWQVGGFWPSAAATIAGRRVLAGAATPPQSLRPRLPRRLLAGMVHSSTIAIALELLVSVDRFVQLSLTLVVVACEALRASEVSKERPPGAPERPTLQVAQHSAAQAGAGDGRAQAVRRGRSVLAPFGVL